MFVVAQALHLPISQIEQMPAVEFDCWLLFLSEQIPDGQSQSAI